MQLHDQLFKNLVELKPQDKQSQARQFILEYFKTLEDLKKQNYKEYERSVQFHHIQRGFYKGLFEMDTGKFDQIFLFYPLIHITNFQKYQQINKQILRALYQTYRKYLQLMESKKLYIIVSEFVIENIGIIDLKEFSHFCQYLKCNLAKNKNKINDKVKEMIQHSVKSDRKSQFLSALEIINKCQLQQNFDTNYLQKIVIQMNIVQEYFNIIKKNKKKCLKLLNNLNPNQHEDIMKKIINQHKLDYKQFKDLIDFQSYKFLNFLFKNQGLEKAEDRFSLDENHIEMLLDYLINRKKDYNQAFSVYQRNKKLLNQDIQQQYYDFETNQQQYQYIPNNIVEKNFFGPASICLEKTENFITLNDLKYKKEDIIFVSNNNMSQHTNCLDNVNKVGVDCEFYSEDFSTFAQHKLATFQMATKNKIYIFDCIDLIKNEEFKNFFINLFQSPAILKIGHTFKGDIEVFEKTFKTHIKYQRNIKNVEKLYSKNPMSLAKLVFTFFNKELCKFEQTSSWQRRPLRQTQLHYAALDAAILLDLHEILSQNQQQIQKSVINKPQQKMQYKSYRQQQKEMSMKKYQENLQQSGDIAKFYADGMLEKLTRQLRNLGFDTKYRKNTNKNEIFKICLNENRVLLTTNKTHLKSSSKALVFKIENGKAQDQVDQVLKNFSYNLKKENLHSRCIECNNDSFLIKDKDQVKLHFNNVDYIQPEEIDLFYVCENCQHIFWKGSQYEKSQKQFQKHLDKNCKQQKSQIILKNISIKINYNSKYLIFTSQVYQFSK